MNKSSAALGAALLLLNGCSLIFPHPATIPDAGMQQCPLDVLTARRQITRSNQARGIPSPLVIRSMPSPEGDRSIQNGQSIYFVATHRDADRAVGAGSGSNGHVVISIEPKQPPSASTIWQVEALDEGGKPLPVPSVVADAGLVRLRGADGYLVFTGERASFTPRAPEASRFRIYKADVPDSTRPTTCDATLRDADFVFLRAVSPSFWVDATDAGRLFVGSSGASNPSAANANPVCEQEEQRCHNDASGGLVCAWAPKCATP